MGSVQWVNLKTLKADQFKTAIDIFNELHQDYL